MQTEITDLHAEMSQTYKATGGELSYLIIYSAEPGTFYSAHYTEPGLF